MLVRPLLAIVSVERPLRAAMKKVLLVVIDALASRIIVPAMKEGKLPCLAALASHGVLRPECTSIFPSITPAATASIVTGVYPVQHDIAGAFWFDREEDSVAYYGDDFWVLVNEGIGTFFDDFLLRLNHGRLHADTLYQIVERNGLTAAAINFMWFRGETKHSVNAPLLFQLIPGVKVAPQVMGPKVLALADFAASSIPGRDEPLSATGGLTRRYGFHDETTAEYLMDLASSDPFPDFTLAYFPNNDFVSHDEGPQTALEIVQVVDRHLASFIDAMGGMDCFLNQFAILILGDHSQCDMIRDESGRGINLVEILDSYQLAVAGQPWKDEDDMMVCPNMRSCHIYLQKRDAATRDKVIERLLSDPRVDQVFWQSSAWDSGRDPSRVDPRSDCFHVATAERGSLEFRHASKGDPADGHDVYESPWQWQGELLSIDARLDDDDRLEYGDYPNALERISTGFCNFACDLWVTAKSGCEFQITETSIHEGGSHGALNKEDSTTPLIVAGLPEHVDVPEFPRTIDAAHLCLRSLGLKAEADKLIASRIGGRPK